MTNKVFAMWTLLCDRESYIFILRDKRGTPARGGTLPAFLANDYTISNEEVKGIFVNAEYMYMYMYMYMYSLYVYQCVMHAPTPTRTHHSLHPGNSMH